MAAALRAVAIAIAIAGFLDPSLRANRPVKPEVAVIDAGAPELASRLADVLTAEFIVVPGPDRGAAATVVAGDHLPADASAVGAAGFVVTPSAARHGRIVDVRAPSRAAPASRVPVVVTMEAVPDSGATLSLDVDGVVQDVVAIDPMARVAELSFVPLAPGPMVARVVARGAGEADGATAAVVIDVRPDPWRLLFFDTRPSWTSTFLRRAVEGDPRFEVSARIVTSRNVSLEVGGAPASLRDQNALSGFDAIVVGAPEGLVAADAAGLEAFARTRGGTVVLAIEQRGAGPYERLFGGERIGWQQTTSPGVIPIQPARGGLAAFQANEFVWPRPLPASAESLAHAPADGLAGGPGEAAVWRMPLGAGQVVVNGALDAWRHRATPESGFDDFWRLTLAEAADRALRPVDIRLTDDLLPPGGRLTATIVLRDEAMTAGRNEARTTVVTATIDGPDGERPVRVWPDGPAGQLRASLTMPRSPGVYRLTVTAGERRGQASVLVAAGAGSSRAADPSGVLAVWAASRGGRVVTEDAIDELPRAIADAVSPSRRERDWHPMRSAWWIAPFALALGGEWWWRRRRGLR
jgi:hypothetical protein